MFLPYKGDQMTRGNVPIARRRPRRDAIDDAYGAILYALGFLLVFALVIFVAGPCADFAEEE